MTDQVPSSVFLERRSYRRRRMMDALRLLPIVGVMLWMLPLFWPSAPRARADAIPMSTAIIYVFAVWLVLIAAAFALWRGIWPVRQADPPRPGRGEDEGAT